MNELIIQLPHKPISVNQRQTIHKHSRFLTKKTVVRNYEAFIKGKIEEQAAELKIFANRVDPSKHALELEIVMYVPEAEFFTKKGTVNNTCIDCSNVTKTIEDTIYKRLGINDGQNIKVITEKRPVLGSEWLTLVTISIVGKPKVCYLDLRAAEWYLQ